MKKTKILQDVELFNYILKRPGMFSIHNVEDFRLFFTGYLCGKGENELSDYLENFNDFVISKFSKEYFDEFSFEKIIRLHGRNDIHSLELLNELIIDFNTIDNFNIPPSG